MTSIMTSNNVQVVGAAASGSPAPSTESDAAGDRGRRVVASQGLAVADLAFRARPYATVLLPELWSSHCHKCFSTGSSSGRALSRCGRCRTAYYCSRECQQQDWKPDHRVECKRLAQLVALELRSDQVSDVVLLGRVMRRAASTGVEPEEDSEPSPMDLVWHQEDLEGQELLLLATMAQKLQLVDASKSTEELQRMLSRFHNNNFSVCDELLLEVGTGCFPLGAMVNHSCEPNCAVTFVPKTLEMEFRVMTELQPGEEITQTYVDVALPRRERQQRIQHKYHFQCECPRCAQSLQDPESHDAFLDADVDGIPQENWPQERQKLVEAALTEMDEAAGRAIMASDPVRQQQQHIDALKALLARQSELLHRENIALLQTNSALFSAEMERGSVAEALVYGERMLAFYRRVYNQNHPMTGLHLFTLGDLETQRTQIEMKESSDDDKATAYLSEARDILQTTHGKNHRFVKMLTQRLEDRSSR